MHVLDFLTELEKAEVSVTLLKSDLTTEGVPAIFKFLKTNKGSTCDGVSFWHIYVGRLDSSKFLKGTLLKTLFFRNFHLSETAIFPTISQICMKRFFKKI